MDIVRMKEILKTQYGICDEAELYAAMSKSAGIDIGIFTNPVTERSSRYEHTSKKEAIA